MKPEVTQLLACAGRLLLEYNESTGQIHHALEATSRTLTEESCDIVVSYNGVAVSVAGDGPLLMQVRELRYNTALQARVHSILRRVRQGEFQPAAALSELRRLESVTPRHAPWVVVFILGAAGASLAGLLGADIAASAIAGLSTALGLIARQQLSRRHFNLLVLPLTAAFIGALLGGLAIRLGWTRTPGLVLIVPSLMLIPGPHLINGLLDLVDNYIPMALARLGLAASIIVASGLGIIMGMELTLPAVPVAEESQAVGGLNVFTDMFLAGIATIGFACFYNTAIGRLSHGIWRYNRSKFSTRRDADRRRRELQHFFAYGNQRRAGVLRSRRRRRTFPGRFARFGGQSYVPLLARVGTRRATGADLWLPNRRTVESGARTAV